MSGAGAGTRLSHDEVVRVLGEIDAHLVAEIIDSGATLGDIEAVAAFLAGETDVMGDLRRPLTGRAAVIHEMLRRAEDNPDAER